MKQEETRQDSSINQLYATASLGSPGSSSEAPAPLGLTVTAYAQIAADFADGMAKLAGTIPYLLAVNLEAKKSLRVNHGVSTDFIVQAIAAVEGLPEVQAVNVLDTNAADDAVQYAAAFQPAISKLKMLFEDLQFSVDSKRAAVVTGALDVYDLTKSLARDPSRVNVPRYVDLMRKALNRGRKSRAGAQTSGQTNGQPETTQPAPAPVVTHS